MKKTFLSITMEDVLNIKPFMDSFTIESFILIGNSTKALRDRIKAYRVKPRKLIGGWTN